MDSIGDLARSLVLRTNQVRLRSEMDRLAFEVSTGIVKDPAKHLAGDLSSILGIDNRLSRLDTYRVNTTEAALVTGAMQSAMGKIDAGVDRLSATLLPAELTPSEGFLNLMSADATETLQQVLGSLNSSVAGRFLFSGTATRDPAMGNAADLIEMFRQEIAAPTFPSTGAPMTIETADDLMTLAEAFFLDDATNPPPPGTDPARNVGAFYTGSQVDLAPLKIGEDEEVTLSARADDPEFRAIMMNLAVAAVVNDTAALGFSLRERAELLGDTGQRLKNLQQTLVEKRAQLGATEARIEDTVARNSAERTAAGIARTELVGTDPYETASRYEEVRMQLEGLYAITARSQRLSLTGFL